MPVRVVPTLAPMAEVYRLPSEGGPSSPRFNTYLSLIRSGMPLSGFNPMTNKDVLGTIEELLAFDAERVLQDAADDLAIVDDVDVFITVATPGVWTDRLATEIDHRLVGRSWPQVLWWTGSPVNRATFLQQAQGQLVRAGWTSRYGPPETLADAAGQEGLALSFADEGALHADVASALDVLGHDRSLATMVAVLYGDDAAQAMGFSPVGLGPGAGLRHCAAVAQTARRGRDLRGLLAARWSPVLSR